MPNSIQLAEPRRQHSRPSPDHAVQARGGFSSSSRSGFAVQSTSYRPHEITLLLHQLGVPFATFDPIGHCTELSPSARSLLGDDAERVCRLGARLLQSMFADDHRHGDPTDTVCELDPVGRHILRAQRLPSGDVRRAGILILLPMRTTSERVVPPCWGLSHREMEVAMLIAEGAATTHVACALGISVHTVRRHIERIYAKAGVQSRMQLAVLVGSVPSRTGDE
jgi:DNA-binding CsgD family transcriptional regulator